MSERSPLIPHETAPSISRATSDLAQSMEKIEKSLGWFSSFALIVNNISGPGMMSLPQIFFAAGYIPACACIALVCTTSALTGTLFSQAISTIPGNAKFSKNIGYATAFECLVHPKFAKLAENLFVVACMIQCSTGIVQASQSLDAFLASFLLGETYALQISPEFKFIQWSEDGCKDTGVMNQDTLNDCVPFYHDGPLVISLGFVLVTALFLPLGLRNIKETMIVQLISFAFLLIVAVQFNVEFLSKGMSETIPAFGSDMTHLVGVVLFNFDYVITVPAWLIEKKNEVNPNTMIWSTSIFCSILYVCFGYLAATCFGADTEKMMALLESNEVPPATRWCAALFGICIIGAGVPVFSVIIKNTLYNMKMCNENWSLFIGSVLPYCVSWVLYQGELVTDVLSWAGLIVNGLIAFVFPIILCYHVFVQNQAHKDYKPRPGDLEMTYHGTASRISRTEEEEEDCPPQSALSDCIEPFRSTIITTILVLFVVMIGSTVIVDSMYDLE